MPEYARHVPLLPVPWNASEARRAIELIVSDALVHFDAERFWPAHPLDEGVPDGHTSIYCGATGVIWALEYLARMAATEAHFDFRRNLPRLIEANKAEFQSGYYSEHGSLLFGDLGAALLAMRLTPSPAIADTIQARGDANTSLPIRELMWGLPGSMLACIHMAKMTHEPRWRVLFAAQAARLFDELEETANGPLWTQDLYGQCLQYLGPVHGFAGNMIPLIRGWGWLAEDHRARITEAVPRTLALNAWHSNHGVNWGSVAARNRSPWLCQYCHGAPGMVTTFSDAPFTSPELEALLLKGGKFIWAAEPLAKGSNLCHGTAGNGFAFLKLYRRTKDTIWLERAQAFAMTAIAQCREARERYGRGRYSLWTGDIGLAVYLWDCLRGEPRFPTIDVF
jgi:hypothetical protein